MPRITDNRGLEKLFRDSEVSSSFIVDKGRWSLEFLGLEPWFKVAISVADSDGPET